MSTLKQLQQFKRKRQRKKLHIRDIHFKVTFTGKLYLPKVHSSDLQTLLNKKTSDPSPDLLNDLVNNFYMEYGIDIINDDNETNNKMLKLLVDNGAIEIKINTTKISAEQLFKLREQNRISDNVVAAAKLEAKQVQRYIKEILATVAVGTKNGSDD